MWTELNQGVSSKCYIKNGIVKKIYNKNNKDKSLKRMANEINALTLLNKYKYFPKIIKTDWKNLTIYMNYVGVSIENLSYKILPNNIIYQLNQIKNALNKEGITHTDLSLDHFLLYRGTISLIDFEKNDIDKKIKTIYPKYPIYSKTTKGNTIDNIISQIRNKYI